MNDNETQLLLDLTRLLHDYEVKQASQPKPVVCMEMGAVLARAMCAVAVASGVDKKHVLASVSMLYDAMTGQYGGATYRVH